MKRFKKILAPTDFSPLSDAGLRYAHFLAGEFGSEVLVFHVLTPREITAAILEFMGRRQAWRDHPAHA